MRIIIIKTKSCMKCRTIVPKFLKEIESIPDIVQPVDVLNFPDDEDSKEFAEKYHITQSPTFLIFKDNDKSDYPMVISGDKNIPAVLNYIKNHSTMSCTD